MVSRPGTWSHLPGPNSQDQWGARPHLLLTQAPLLRPGLHSNGTLGPSALRRRGCNEGQAALGPQVHRGEQPPRTLSKAAGT